MWSKRCYFQEGRLQRERHRPTRSRQERSNTKRLARKRLYPSEGCRYTANCMLPAYSRRIEASQLAEAAPTRSPSSERIEVVIISLLTNVSAPAAGLPSLFARATVRLRTSSLAMLPIWMLAFELLFVCHVGLVGRHRKFLRTHIPRLLSV